MKKIIFVLSVTTLSLISFGQTSTAKADSIKKAEEQKAVVEIITKTPIQKMQEWLFETMTARQYNDFIQYYSAFVRKELDERAKKK